MAVDEFHERFGQRLRDFRRRQGLSQEALGALIPMSADALGLLERGASGPRLATIVRIADALGIRPSELLSFSDDVETSADRTEVLRQIESQLLSVNDNDLKQVVELIAIYVAAYQSGRDKS